MADVVIGAQLKLDSNDGLKSVKDIRKALQEAKGDLTAMTAEFGATSKEASIAAKRVAEIKDELGDANSLVDAFNPDTKFRAFGAAINTVVGGFSALQGVMGLVGVESEEVQKSLLKVQSALALSQGISQLQEGVQTFKNLGAVIQQTTVFQKANNAATVAASTVMKAFGVSVETTSTSFKVLKGAIVATGIGALLVLVTEAASAMGLFSDSTDEATKAQEDLQKAIDRTNDSLNTSIGILNRQEKLAVAEAKRRGATEKEIFDIEQGYRRQRLEATADQYEKVNKLDEVQGFKILQSIKDQNAAGQVAQIEFEIAEEKRIKDRNERLAKEAKEASAKRLAQLKEDFIIEQQVKAAAITGRVTVDPSQAGKSVEEAEIERIAAVNKRFRLEMTEDDEIYTNNYLENIEARKANEEAEYQNRKTLMVASSGLLDAFGSLVGKQTAAGKVLGIAQATINTFIGATEVLRAKSVLPEPAGTIAKIVNVAAVIASGLAAVKNIIKTPVPGAAGGAAPSVSAPLAVAAPTATSTRLDQQSLNAIGSATTRAFVVESDVSNSQERIRRINRAARI